MYTQFWKHSLYTVNLKQIYMIIHNNNIYIYYGLYRYYIHIIYIYIMVIYGFYIDIHTYIYIYTLGLFWHIATLKKNIATICRQIVSGHGIGSGRRCLSLPGLLGLQRAVGNPQAPWQPVGVPTDGTQGWNPGSHRAWKFLKRRSWLEQTV